MRYEAKTFNIPELEGISQKTVDEHLKLYDGYVKHTNKIAELVSTIDQHDEYAVKEAHRRLGFEFDGMRNHEYYFAQIEDGAQALDTDGPLAKQMDSDFGGHEKWMDLFKGTVAKQRGVGWAVLGYDQHAKCLVNYWVDEQQISHLTGVQPIFMLDMWEHSYCMDYAPSEKADYVDAYIKNVNWGKSEHVFEWVSK
jgi:Fe-Mn family superoxide dismutase